MAKDLDLVKDIVFICNGNSCLNKGAEENTNILRQALKTHQIDDDTHTIKTRCSGQCKEGPIVFVYPDGVWYKKVDQRKSEEIVTNHLINRKYLDDSILAGIKRRKGKVGLFSKIFRVFTLISLLILLSTPVQKIIKEEIFVASAAKSN